MGSSGEIARTNFGRGSSTVAQYLASHAAREQHYGDHSHRLIHHGTNDFVGGATEPTVSNGVLAIAQGFKAANPAGKVYLSLHAPALQHLGCAAIRLRYGLDQARSLQLQPLRAWWVTERSTASSTSNPAIEDPAHLDQWLAGTSTDRVHPDTGAHPPTWGRFSRPQRRDGLTPGQERSRPPRRIPPAPVVDRQDDPNDASVALRIGPFGRIRIEVAVAAEHHCWFPGPSFAR